jgi:sialic acid synthase SpsE
MQKIIQTEFSRIGEGEKCFVIAEIGSNHNGNYNLACELMAKAAEAGANAVKFQTFKASNHYSKKTPKIAMYEQNIYDLIESLEIDRSWHEKLSEECKKLKIDFLDSPCDIEAVNLAVKVRMPLIKVASFDMVDLQLIRSIAKTKKAVMFSTGMANLSEIQAAINVCRSENNNQIIALQCTSLYPAPPHLSNLKAMEAMRRMFNVITGYSDHTLGDHISLAAVGMGANVIEKHYTLSRTLPGPDHAFGIEPNELKEMISKIRDIETAMGNGEKNGPRKEESELFEKARRSIIARVPLKVGHVIREEDLVIKRPGTGVHPSMWDLVIGRTVKKEMDSDESITWDKI